MSETLDYQPHIDASRTYHAAEWGSSEYPVTETFGTALMTPHADYVVGATVGGDFDKVSLAVDVSWKTDDPELDFPESLDPQAILLTCLQEAVIELRRCAIDALGDQLSDDYGLRLTAEKPHFKGDEREKWLDGLETACEEPLDRSKPTYSYLFRVIGSGNSMLKGLGVETSVFSTQSESGDENGSPLYIVYSELVNLIPDKD
jgi:hypothetical protein